jgi:amino acid permease
MVLLPGLFAGAGLTFPLLVTLLVALLSSLSVLFLAKMIQSIPGNSDYTQRIEFSKLIRRLFPKWLYVCAFFAMIFNLQVRNISKACFCYFFVEMLLCSDLYDMTSTFISRLQMLAPSSCLLKLWTPLF